MKSDTLYLKNVRITFPKLLDGDAEQFDGKGDMYYSASYILAPDHPQLAEIKARIHAAAVAKFGDKAEDLLKVFAKKDKLPIHDGDLKSSKPYGAAYKDQLYISARNNARTNPPIPVYDNVKDAATGYARVITSKADSHFPYSGAYVNVHLNFFGYEAGGGQGVGASIAGVQWNRDGERLSGGVQASADKFEAADVEDVFPSEPKQDAPKAGAKSFF
jgi:hypothetical protein